MNVENTSLLVAGGLFVLFLVGFVRYHWKNERARDKAAQRAFHLAVIVTTAAMVYLDRGLDKQLARMIFYALGVYFSIHGIGAGINNLILSSRVKDANDYLTEEVQAVVKWVEQYSVITIAVGIAVSIAYIFFGYSGETMVLCGLIFGSLYGYAGSLQVTEEQFRKYYPRLKKRNLI